MEHSNSDQPLDSVIPLENDIYRMYFALDAKTGENVKNFCSIANTSVTELTRRSIVTMDVLSDCKDMQIYNPESGDKVHMSRYDIFEETELLDEYVDVKVNITNEVCESLEGTLRLHPSETLSSIMTKGMNLYSTLYAYASSGYKITAIQDDGRMVPIYIYNADTDQAFDRLTQEK